jgi:predicted lipid carrier protein YhbT
VNSPAEYFNGFLSRHLNRPLLAGYDRLSAAFVVHFRDVDECWLVRIEAGCITQIHGHADLAEAPVRFSVDLPVFSEMTAGTLSPQVAFFTRRTEIHGDLFTGMKLARILGLFFRAYPYG